MNNSSLQPILYDIRKESLEDFQKRLSVHRILDTCEIQLKELFLIRNPRFRFQPPPADEIQRFIDEQRNGKPLQEVRTWFYFPWNQTLVHYLPDELHQELRTARNKNLITAEEQRKFYDFIIGITGLSVGSHAALTLAMMGAGRVMKLADPDEVSGSNLNRIRANATMIDANKCDLVAQEIYQINPYAQLQHYSQGVTIDNLTEFLAGPPKLNVLIEELDNLEMKIRLRLACREMGIPVVMATDNGDNVIVDIERYDLDPRLPLFNGVAGDLTLEEFQKMQPQELPKLATKIAGPEFVTPSMLASVLEVGKTLYSWPQLGDAATLSGVAIAYIVKRLALGQPLKSGKLEVNLDAVFDPEYHSPGATAERNTRKTELLKRIGLDEQKTADNESL